MPPPKVDCVFKVALHNAWEQACRSGTFRGSEDDLRDGFIHLSALHQLGETLAKHFKGQPDLVLIAFNAEALGDALRWERSRNGDLFPHFHAPLPTAAARVVHALELDENGVPIVPKDVGQC